MAIPTNIQTLLNGNIVESARLEFKKNWNPESILHTICAFANDMDNWGGGYVIIGIDEDKGKPRLPISGLNLKEIDKIQKDLLNKCKLIQTEYMPIVEPVIYQNKHILIVWCPGGSIRPYKCPITLDREMGKGYAYYVRKMSSTIKATAEIEKELYALSNQVPFDDRINHKAQIQDLKLPLIQNYLYEIKSKLYEESKDMDFVELCQSLRIVDGTPEYLKPVNVGLLFFNDLPQNFFPYSQIEIVDLRKGIEGDYMTEHIFKGPLDYMIKSALRFLENNVIEEKIEKVAYQAEAIRYFNYPYPALEEALVNAMYHRRL